MNNHRLSAALFMLGVSVVSIVLLSSRSAPPIVRSDPAMALLSAAAAPGFMRATHPRALEFPRDHGPHADFRSEWWYFTGHLDSVDEPRRRFGFQLTLFRFELDASHEPSPSAWRTPRVMLGHFAISDLDGGRFFAYERLSRAVPAIAGATVQPPTVWLDEWRIAYDTTAQRWRLHARHRDSGLTLELEALAAIVRQGEAGLSRKSAAPGNASHYYSIPRLSAHGEVIVAGTPRRVAGTAWLDREWSTSALDPAQSGWDWFALQFDDGANLMFYRLRRHDGSDDPHSAGSYVAADGEVTALAAGDVAISVERRWTSPATAISYPAAWRLHIERLGLTLRVQSSLADQEWRQRFRYWEGAVTVAGARESGGVPVLGRGYVELTGY